MKLLVDANLSPSVSAGLTEAGFEALHVGDVDLLTASDAAIIDYARANDLLVVTVDSDFAAILAIGDAARPSVVQLRDVGELAPSVHLALLTSNLGAGVEDLQAGAIDMDLRERLGGGVLALADRDAVVGFCEFGPTEDQDDDPSQVGHVMRIFIRPTHQGRGGGKQLMAAARARLAKQGFASATLWTPEDRWNHRALEFYRRLGWTQEDARAPGGDIRRRLVLR